MPTDSPMRNLGRVQGYEWYEADSRFESPGVYYFDKEKNINVNVIKTITELRTKLQKITDEADRHADGTSDSTPLEKFANEILGIVKSQS